MKARGRDCARRGIVAIFFLLALTGLVAADAAARPACQGNLVQGWGFDDSSAWQVVDGSPDFAAGSGALNAGYVGMWGNQVVGEALSQRLGGAGLVAGETYMIDVWVRHVSDPTKLAYSEVRLAAFDAADQPTSYADLFAASVTQIGFYPKVSSTDWQRVSLGSWTATRDLSHIAVHIVNQQSVDDGSQTSYANLDNLCIRPRVPPTVCGHKFQDRECDGERGAGDAGLAGWTILLESADGDVRITTTGPDGGYCFDDLAAGDYTVSEAARPGWVQTAPKAQGAGWVQVGVEGDVEGPDFGNQLCARCPDGPDDACPDPADPRVSYVSEDPAVCQVIRFTCPPDAELFSGPCGCGCIAPCGDTKVVSGLHYPGETCSSAVPALGADNDSFHFRQACADAAGQMPERVTVKAVTACVPEGDGVRLDAEICCPEPPGEPDLELTKELVGPTDDMSVHLVFALTVTNRGDAAMPGPVEIRDTLPAGYRFAGGAGCSSADGTVVTCSSPDGLAPGEEVRFEVVAQLDRSAFNDRTNCAALISGGGSDADNDAACLPLLCPDPNASDVHYFTDRGSRDEHARCPRLKVRCGDEQTFFWGACGCGCIDDPQCVQRPNFGGGGTPLSAAEPAQELTGLLSMPDELQPGDRVVLTPRDPERTPADGTWSINGRVVEPMEPSPTILCPPDHWWPFDVPGDWQVGDAVRVVYESPAGEVLVDALSDAVVGEPVDEADQARPPSIDGGTDFTVPGGEACVCGSFPGAEAKAGLLFEGEALGVPLAASRDVVEFMVPDSTELGDRWVTGWPSAGFSSEDRWQVGVVEVRASLDQSTLMRGGSTRLFLQVLGTDRPVTLRLQNFSPSVVAVEGGDDQQLTTSGGEENVAIVNVRGIGDGDFDLRWELPGCPCGEAR